MSNGFGSAAEGKEKGSGSGNVPCGGNWKESHQTGELDTESVSMQMCQRKRKIKKECVLNQPAVVIPEPLGSTPITGLFFTFTIYFSCKYQFNTNITEEDNALTSMKYYTKLFRLLPALDSSRVTNYKYMTNLKRI